jgi:hypothetical protein
VCRVQPDGSKSAPLSPSVASFATDAGEGRGGEGPYVHTHMQHLTPIEFEGSTTEYFEKERKRKRYHTVAQICGSLWKIGEEEQAKWLISCGNWFNAYKTPCGTVKLMPYHCNSPFCPGCCNRRSISLQKRISERINQSQHDYWHLVITVVSWADLSKPALKRLNKNLARLRETDVWKEQVTGGVYSVETTWNEGSGWHPHFHVLIETPKKLPLDWITRLKAKWLEITGDSHYIRLERMYGLDKKGRKTRKLNKRAIREIVKYATKAASFATRPELVRQFLDAFKNSRRMQAFGSFLGVTKEADKDEEKAAQPVGCACGKCLPEQFKLFRCVHVSDTRLMADGSRQLKLFEGLKPEGPPGDWLSENEYKRVQSKLQTAMFAGPLFDGAAL